MYGWPGALCYMQQPLPTQWPLVRPTQQTSMMQWPWVRPAAPLPPMVLVGATPPWSRVQTAPSTTRSDSLEMMQDAQVAQGSSTATPQIVSDTDDLVLEMPVGPPPPVPVVPGLQGSRIVVDNIPVAGGPDFKVPDVTVRRRMRKKTQDLHYIASLITKFDSAKSLQPCFSRKFTCFPDVDLSDQAHAELMDKVNALLATDAANGGRAQALWPGLLAKTFPELKGLPLDHMLVRFVLRCWQHRHEGADSAFREFCAGKANLTFQLLRQGLEGFAFDIDYSSGHNMEAAIGLRLWLDAISNSRHGSLDWFGTKCSPFVGVNQSVTNRREENGWLGDQSKMFVRRGNLQMVVTSLGFALSCLCNNYPVLEQPVTSCMPKCQPLAMVTEHFKCQRVITWHGAFDNKTPKCLQLITPLDAMRHVSRPRPKGLGRLFTVTPDGKFHGKKRKLKESQTYSVEFAKCVADIVAKKLKTI